MKRVVPHSQGENHYAPNSRTYEVAIRVRDLVRAEQFYRGVLGLEVGLRDERRNWIFMRAGGSAGMIVLQEDRGEWPVQHFAFSVDEGEIERAAQTLRGRGRELDVRLILR